MRTFRSLLVLAALIAPGFALAQTEEEAGDVSEVDKDRVGPLRERVRPVSGHLFLKKGRFEFSPSASISLNDAFFRKYVFGATLSYFPTETVGVGLRFGYAVPTVSGAAQICTTQGAARTCNVPTYEQLDGRAPGQLTLLGGIDAHWSPLYGKVALVAESFMHFDLYGIVGASAINYNGPPDDISLPGSKSVLTFGGNVGVGMRFHFNKWLAVRTELRDLIYVEQISGQTAGGLRNQMLFELGFSMFFPTVFTPE